MKRIKTRHRDKCSWHRDDRDKCSSGKCTFLTGCTLVNCFLPSQRNKRTPSCGRLISSVLVLISEVEAKLTVSRLMVDRYSSVGRFYCRHLPPSWRGHAAKGRQALGLPHACTRCLQFCSSKTRPRCARVVIILASEAFNTYPTCRKGNAKPDDHKNLISEAQVCHRPDHVRYITTMQARNPYSTNVREETAHHPQTEGQRLLPQGSNRGQPERNPRVWRAASDELLVFLTRKP